ncbi:hypothetical protein BGZ49_004576 [Haplosporangium sp. Z 27]|nr:hypothetical protein BGZ49_004576 [Haplosporangium sp. Z 27]
MALWFKICEQMGVLTSLHKDGPIGQKSRYSRSYQLGRKYPTRQEKTRIPEISQIKKAKLAQMAAINTKVSLTDEQRKKICLQRDSNPKWRQEELADWARTAFDLPVKPTQAMISRIVNNKSYQ